MLEGGMVKVNRVGGVCLSFPVCWEERDIVSAFKLSSPALAVLLSQISKIKLKADIGFGFLF